MVACSKPQLILHACAGIVEGVGIPASQPPGPKTELLPLSAPRGHSKKMDMAPNHLPSHLCSLATLLPHAPELFIVQVRRGRGAASKVFLVPACWVKAPCAVGQGYQNQDVQNACIYTLLGPPADLSHGQAQSAQTREARVLWPYYPAAKTQENSLNHRGSAYSKV